MYNSLYGLSTEYINALAGLVIDEETGEVTNFEAIESLNKALDEKAEAVACYIKDLEHLASGIITERNNLTDRLAKTNAKIESLKKYLSRCLNAAGKDKVETAKACISFRKSTAVQIDYLEALPREYLSESVLIKANKQLIKQAFKDGKNVTGASLIETRKIQIK